MPFTTVAKLEESVANSLNLAPNKKCPDTMNPIQTQIETQSLGSQLEV
jgi:hypothetical protein